MERTAELLRCAMRALPDPPGTTIEVADEVEFLDADSAADEEGSAAGELSGGAVHKGGLGSSGLGGGAVNGAGATSNGAPEGALAGQESKDHAGNHKIIYCPSFDLYLYYRPVSDFWEEIWKNTPLVLHDKELLNASRNIHHEKGVALIKDRGTNFTREITGILNNHPGPLSNFRLDSSVWSGGGDQLGQWMQTASEKGVEEIIIVNSELPTDLSFAITTIRSPMLRRLSLGFMQIRGLAIGDFDYSSLTELSLFGCTYDGDALSAVISDYSSLRALVIGGSVQSIRLVSQSLLTMQICMSTCDSVVIEYAPKLRVLATGVRPRDGGSPVLIDINSAHALTEIHYLMLPHHNLTIRSASVIKGLICLSSVRKLRLGVAMADSHQRSGLVQVLHRLPYLDDLVIWRMDKVSIAEGSDVAIGSPFTALSSLPCVTLQLTHLLMEEFQGGRAEMALIGSVLAHAQNLLEVKIEPNVASVEQANILLNYYRASKRCQLIF